MEFIDVRNTLVSLMSRHLNVPVILSDQTTPETSYPYIYYTVITPPQGLPGSGDNRSEIVGDDVFTMRYDQPSVTISFTVCSRNRYENSILIYGDDEALQITDKAQNYLKHIGYHDLSLEGIVVVDITNVGMRSGFVVDEFDRRYGFDCRIRFEHIINRNDGAIDYINTKRSEQ